MHQIIRNLLVATFLGFCLCGGSVATAQNFKYEQLTGDVWEYDRRAIEFDLRAIEHYKKISNHSDQTKSELSFWMEKILIGITNGAPEHHIRSLGRRLEYQVEALQADDDPLVLLIVTASNLPNIGFRRGKIADVSKAPIQVFSKAGKALDAAKYPGQIGLLARRLEYVLSLNIMRSEVQLPPVNRTTTASVDLYADYLVEWLEENLVASPLEHRFVCLKIETFFQNVDFNQHDLEKLQKRVSSSSKIPAWIQQVFLGMIEYELAWTIRGKDSTDQVSRRKLEQFVQHKKRATDHCNKALEINPHYPEPAAMMIAIVREEDGSGTDEAIKWFGKAIKCQYDYEHAYHQMFFSLRPRWGGNHEDILAFGKQCYKEAHFDTTIPHKLFNAIREVMSDGNKTIHEDPETVEMLLDMLEKTYQSQVKVAQSKQNRERQLEWLFFIRSQQAALYSISGDHKNAVRLYTELGTSLDPRALSFFRHLPKALEDYRLESILAVKGYSIELLQVMDEFAALPEDRSLSHGQILEKAGEALRDRNKTDEHDQWRKCQRAIKIEKQFQAGSWVNLTFDEQLSDWQSIDEGKFTVINENKLRIDNRNQNGFVFLKHIAAFDGAKIIEFDLEVLEPNEPAGIGPYRQHFFAGFAVGQAKRFLTHHWEKHGNGFKIYGMHARENVAGYAIWHTADHFLAYNWAKKKNHFQLFEDRAFYELHINGQQLMVKSHRFGSIDPHVGIAVCPYEQNVRGVIEISNIRIRKWDHEKIDNRASIRVSKEYWSRRAKANDENHVLWELAALFAMLDNDNELMRNAIKRAEALTTSRRNTGYVLGEYAEKKRDLKAALKHYRSSIDSAPITAVHPISGIDSTSYSTLVYRSMVRYLWLTGAHPSREIQNTNRFFEAYAKFEPKHYLNWHAERLIALDASLRGDFEKAVKHCERALELCPANQRTGVRKQLEAYKTKKRFFMEKGEKPFYFQK